MGRSEEDLAAEQDRIQNYLRQCEALTTDWNQLRQLVMTYPEDHQARSSHDLHLLGVKGRISCDYPIVQAWRSGEYAIGSDIHAVVSELTDIPEVAAQRNGVASKFNERWGRVHGKLGAAREVLAETHQKLASGQPVEIPKTFRQTTRKVEIPWKKIARYTAVAVTLLVVAATLYVMRNFLGFWAPGEGEGIEFAVNTPPREQVETALKIMQESMVNNDLDSFMTVFADDFKTPDGEGKTELRALLQTVRTAGEFDKGRLDISQASFAFEDAGIRVSPMQTNAKDFSISFELLFSLRGGKYLAVYGAEVK